MKKHAIIFLSLITISINLNAQKNFKGKIVYSIEFKTESSELNLEEIKKDLGVETVFYYDSGKYFQTYKTGKTEFSFFNASKKTYYEKFRSIDTIYAQNHTKLKDEKLISKRKSKSLEKILNNSSKTLELEIENIPFKYKYFMKFYFIDNIKIKGRKFKNIKASFSNIVYGESNSIPVKFEIIHSNFTIVVTAKNIEFLKDINLDEMISKKLKVFPIKN